MSTKISVKGTTLPLHITDRDERDSAIYSLFGLVAPGGYAILEPDGRLMVWPPQEDSIDDERARTSGWVVFGDRERIYRSAEPISDSEWAVVCSLAWIEYTEKI